MYRLESVSNMACLELKNINYTYPISEGGVVQNIDIKIEKCVFLSIFVKYVILKTT